VQPCASAQVLPGGGVNVENSYSFQVADDAMEMYLHKTLYRFYPMMDFGIAGKNWNEIMTSKYCKQRQIL